MPIPKSEKRKRNHHKYSVRVNSEEFELLELNAKIAGITASNLMRQLGVGYQPRSLVDVSFARELLRLRGDLGRVGGLLKQHIHKADDKQKSSSVMLVKRIKVLQVEIRDVVDHLKQELRL